MKTRKVTVYFEDGSTMVRNLRSFSAGSAIVLLSEMFDFSAWNVDIECEGVSVPFPPSI